MVELVDRTSQDSSSCDELVVHPFLGEMFH